MKKVLTVLMIAVLAAGFVFAGVSGYAQMDLKYNSKDGSFGFFPETKLNVNYTLGESVAKAGEGDVYATADVDMQVYVANYEATPTTTTGKTIEIDVNPSVTAKIVAKNVVLTLKTSSKNPVDFAASTVDTYHQAVYNVWDDKIIDWKYAPISTSLSMYNFVFDAVHNYGVEAVAYDAKVGVVFTGKKGNTPVYNIYAVTPEFDFNGAFAQAGVVAFNVIEDHPIAQISAKAGYTYDAFSIKGATDVIVAKDMEKPLYDISANAAYDFVSFDFYFANEMILLDEVASKKDSDGNYVLRDSSNKLVYEDYMTARLTADFAKFNVPVTVKVTAKNLLNKYSSEDQEARNFKFEAKYTGPVTLNGYIQFSAITGNKYIKYQATCDYNFNDVVTVSGGFYAKHNISDSSYQFMPTVSASSSTLVNGAELSLGWYPNSVNIFGEGNVSSIISGSKDFGQFRARVRVAF